MMLAAAFTLTNCAKEIENPNEQTEAAGYPFEIVASTVDTKTVNDGMSTKWGAGDQINVFHALGESDDYKNDGAFTVSDVDGGVFTGNLVEELDVEEEYDWYVIYPYNAKVTTPGAQTAGYTYIGYRNGMNQQGYDSTASLDGTACPLYGIAKYAGVRPEITMNHLSSVVAINVTNMNEEPLTVTSASFTAPEDIVGSYYIDITKTPVDYKASGANYVSATATVNVSNGTALAQGESAVLYAAIKPFTAATGSKLVLSVNGYEKELTMTKDVTFTAGKIKTLNFGYDKPESSDPEVASFTWNLAKAEYASASTSTVAWTSDYVDMTLSQKTSQTAANNYLGGTSDCTHTRVYKDQILSFVPQEAVQIRKIEFVSISSSYASTAANSTWTNGTASSTSSTVTVTPVDMTESVSVQFSAATRFTSVKVYYTVDPNYVPPTVEYIEVSGNYKTEFTQGDTFSFGGVVTATYDNGDEKDVTALSKFTGYDMETTGDQTVTVSYEGKTTTYEITVAERPQGGAELKSISFKLDKTTTGNTSSSYVTSEKSFTYEGIGFTVNNWNPSSLQIRGNQTASSNMQSGSNFYLRNTTAIPGAIRSITITYTAGTIVNAKTYAQVSTSVITNQTTSNSKTATAGTQEVSWEFDGTGSYFAIGMVKGGTSGTTNSGVVTITYEAN